MTDEYTQIANDLLSPVSMEQRRDLLQEVVEMHREDALSGVHFVWSYEGEEFHRPVLVERIPTAEEWLFEETGQNDFLWGRTSHSDTVFEMAKQTVHNAYRDRFGNDWIDDDTRNDAACQAETRLFEWVEERLKETPVLHLDGHFPQEAAPSSTLRPKRSAVTDTAKWQDEGF